MAEISFKGKIVCVFGPPGSGKTNFIKHIFSKPPYSRHWIYDPMREYDPETHNVIRPQFRRYENGNGELNDVVDSLIHENNPASRPRYFIVDEANRLIPNRKDPGPGVADLIDFNRHIHPGIGFWAVSRRPAQINTDIENLANEYFVFGSRGKNDRSAYANIATDLPDLIDAKNKYECVHVDAAGNCEILEPVENFGETPMH